MNQKRRMVAIIAVVVVVIAAAAGVFIYRNINRQAAVEVEQVEVVSPQEVQELTEEGETQVLRQGEFQDADSLHKGEGAAKVILQEGKPVLSFENFKVTSGPDLFVYLSPNAAGEDLGEFASLGRLQSFSGDQTYALPENHEDYQTVVIWCRAFSVTFATAALE